MQFDTIRKFRTAFSNFVKANPNYDMGNLALVDAKGSLLRLTMDNCSSLWFARFMQGLKYRMGQSW